MNPLVKTLAIFFAASLAFSAVRADDQPNIPASLWEQHPEGIALAVTFTTRAEKDVQGGAIHAFLKNTSSTDKDFEGFDGGHQEFKIFYMDDHGSQIPLRYYKEPDDILGNLLCPVIKPGKTLSLTVDITSVELALIKAHPVKCVFNMIDLAKGGFEIDSSPKVLIGAP